MRLGLQQGPSLNVGDIRRKTFSPERRGNIFASHARHPQADHSDIYAAYLSATGILSPILRQKLSIRWLWGGDRSCPVRPPSGPNMSIPGIRLGWSRVAGDGVVPGTITLVVSQCANRISPSDTESYCWHRSLPSASEVP